MFKNTKYLALLLGCLTVVLLVVAFGRASSGKVSASATIYWEYKVVNKTAAEPSPGLPELEHGLNQLESDGWELVQFVRTEGEARGMWIFKRPK
jgi:hypothetical protein